jgi:hypothetical protein
MCKTVLALIVAVLCVPLTAKAVVYSVNRSFQTSTLTGTVSIPTGSYLIQNQGASPFTNVDLSLTVNGISHHLVNAVTDNIHGTGQFSIDATPTTLTFTAATADGFNPADLTFADTTASVGNNNRYGIGRDVSAFESSVTEIGEFAVHGVTFPVAFGTAIPEPSTLLLLCTGAIVALPRRR